MSLINTVERYLDRVACTDCFCCHLEEIWLFVTGLTIAIHTTCPALESSPSPQISKGRHCICLKLITLCIS